MQKSKLQVKSQKFPFPPEWEIVGLGDCTDRGLIELKRGNIISQKDIQETPGPYPVYSSSIQKEGLFGRYGRYMFNERLITWSIDGGGNFFYRPKHKFSVTNVVGILKLHSDKLVLKFLYYLLSWEHSKLDFDYIKKAHPSVIRDLYFIAFPSLSDQQKIVYVLDAIQEGVKIQEKIIEKTKELKKSFAQKLFREGTRGAKLKKTEIGEIPENWEVVKLKELVKKFLGGGTPSTLRGEYWDGRIPWTTSAPLKEEELNIIKEGQRYISEIGLKNSSTNIVPKGNLLIGTRVGVGKIAINEIDIAINQDLTGLVLTPNITPFYLGYFLLSPVGERAFLYGRRGTTIKGIPRKELELVVLPLPPLPEQREIAEILQAVDRKIEIEQRKKALYEELFKVMVNKLMSGEIEVKKLN